MRAYPGWQSKNMLFSFWHHAPKRVRGWPPRLWRQALTNPKIACGPG